MDSVSQLALGAAVTLSTMGRRTAAWKAALWGGIAGTLPDLDAFIDHGDAILNMVLHRSESHSLFYLTAFALPFAWAVSRLNGEPALFRRWWLALWLALVTHPVLDWFTVYGTQLLLPFTSFPYAVGSLFIIDLLYTLPLLVGVVAALAMRQDRGLAWARGGAGAQHGIHRLERGGTAPGGAKHHGVTARAAPGAGPGPGHSRAI